MIRMRAALLMMVVASSAWASPGADFISTYPRMSEVKRAIGAGQACESLFALPSADYVAQVRALGARWAAEPEATDYLLSTCNTLWSSREFAPLATEQIRRAQKLAALDLLEGAKAALPVRIRAFVDAGAGSGPKPAPFEVLYGMAASARELDLALKQQVSASQQLLLATGAGTLVEVLQATGTAARVGARVGVVGTPLGSALAILVLGGVSVGVEYGAWWKQQSDLWARVDLVRERLEHLPAGVSPTPLYDEFYSAVERLGFFHSLDLLRAPGGRPEASARCWGKLQKFFAAPTAHDWGVKLVRHTLCGDAAAIWAGAAQYLSALRPGDSLATRVSDRLMTRAKHTFTIYMEAEATRPDCRPTLSGARVLGTTVECFDRETGAQIL